MRSLAGVHATANGNDNVTAAFTHLLHVLYIGCGIVVFAVLVVVVLLVWSCLQGDEQAAGVNNDKVGPWLLPMQRCRDDAKAWRGTGMAWHHASASMPCYICTTQVPAS
jgi:hypothetical protein